MNKWYKEHEKRMIEEGGVFTNSNSKHTDGVYDIKIRFFCKSLLISEN